MEKDKNLENKTTEAEVVGSTKESVKKTNKTEKKVEGKVAEELQDSSREDLMNIEDRTLDTDLLTQCGVVIGHPKEFNHPSMKRFLVKDSSEMNSVFDANLCLEYLNAAIKVFENSGFAGEKALWIGTKGMISPIIEEYAQKSGSHYVIKKWLPGNLTNHTTFLANLNKRNRYEKILKDLETKTINVKVGAKSLRYKKKEVEQLKKYIRDFDEYCGGLKNMKELPKLVFIADAGKDEIALKEAKRLKIPVIAIVDSNRDSTLVDYIIPGNDDAIRSVKLIISKLANAYISGLKKHFEKRGILSVEDFSKMQDTPSFKRPFNSYNKNYENRHHDRFQDRSHDKAHEKAKETVDPKLTPEVK